MEICFIGNYIYLCKNFPMETIKTILKKYFLEIIGAIAGAIGGYLYWYFVGCNSGTCPITSNPTNSTIYGVILGVLVFGMFKKNKKQEVESNKDESNNKAE